MIDERIAIALHLEDCLVAMTLVIGDFIFLMPLEQSGDAVRLVFRISAINLARVAQQKVQHCACDRALARAWLKLVLFSLAAFVAHYFIEIAEVEVRSVAAETVAA